MTIAQIYSKFYGLKLTLLKNRDIQVTATRKIGAACLQGALGWLAINKAHVVDRLRREEGK